MLAIPEIADWIQGAVILAVVLGSAFSGLGKAIAAKLNKQQSPPPSSSEREVREARPSRRDFPVPPVAAPMHRPIERPRRVVVRTEKPTARPLSNADEQAEVEYEVALPESIRPLVEMLLQRKVPQDDKPRPVPPPPPRIQRPRPQQAKALGHKPAELSAPAVTERSARLRDIAEREDQQAKLVDRRIGHVETHVRPAAESGAVAGLGAEPAFDRRSLRRAIILNEILGPPVALRARDDQRGAGW